MEYEGDLGQHFTPPDIVERMIRLSKYIPDGGSVLEPSCGDGAFMKHLPKHAVGLEVDPAVADKTDSRVSLTDFFLLPSHAKFSTIIGNPPYVRNRKISYNTTKYIKAGLWPGITKLDKRANLYVYFMSKCLNHLNEEGELIFITPRDFLKSTSALSLNEQMAREGSFTHFYDLGDAKIFEDAMPNCAIWRFQKGLTSFITHLGDSRYGMHSCRDGFVYFSGGADLCNSFMYPKMKRLFDIKVGAVSGADHVFLNNEGNAEMVCSETVKTGKTRRVIYNEEHPSLLKHKEKLLNRRVRKFDESNWWKWGRDCHHKTGERIYVNCKTRHKEPFFVSDVELYDGSVLALFPKKEGVDLKKAAEKLNSLDWEGMGFVCGGRFLFSQKSLECTPVPLPELEPDRKFNSVAEVVEYEEQVG